MSHRIIIRDLAETDITEAAVWYQNQRYGLGQEFLAAMNDAIERAAAHPNTYQRIRQRPDVRRVLTKGFPYRVFLHLPSGCDCRIPSSSQCT